MRGSGACVLLGGDAMLDGTGVFQLTTPVGETFLRGTVTFLAIYAVTRVAGNREAGGHSLTDLLVVVLVAQAAAPGLLGEAEGVLDSLLLVATIYGWSLAIDAVAYKWPALAPLLKSRAVPLIRDGEPNKRALRRELIQHEELMTELRLHGITDLKQVARAYLEPNGRISVIRADSPAPGDTPERPSDR